MTFRGRAAFRELLSTYAAAFSESTHTVVDGVEAGDRVAVEVIWTGVHSGPLRFPGAEIPATGRRVSWPMCMVDRFAGDLIASRHIYADSAQLMAQLGIRSA